MTIGKAQPSPLRSEPYGPHPYPLSLGRGERRARLRRDGSDGGERRDGNGRRPFPYDPSGLMRLEVGGHEVYAYTGARAFDAALPTIVFVHGAALDHSVWAL